ncbi:ferrochelatase [Edwardsiella piscicida]|uniref:Ferrochelatase n=3 Tax=Edwardsiella TaxID=635 RepID=A0A0H3DRA8_EDWTF|nr:ferrochelatase [Edwardsiella piscicida]ACY83871.1 ferrochelatase [Edwardsiella tarda EIB202]ADM41075.1 Ferrochelatase, protoheme ferro-lyase [Edwardsiella tarda FL6-60]ARD17361.1 ferrochelatase [Edwardsiella piscicida]EKS7792082.1 ferrochelatase [Edwardsiella piscicida]ELM3736061.1 ferrochelatase [Edwardsiella piscicida]
MMAEKHGVLLVNLGTPSAATPAAVKAYLAEFLSDRRVVDLPSWQWQPLLRGLILPRRAPRVARLYQSIWTAQGSPLLYYSQRLCDGLQARLGEAIPVALGMSYGEPSLDRALSTLSAAGVTQLTVVPLYPQYSCSTSAAVFDGVAAWLARQRRIPALRFVRDYAQHPAYIAALCQRIRRSIAEHGQPDTLLFSYHGIPQRYADEGDDYPQRCLATTQAVVQALGLTPSQYAVSFQSRFGREPWLTPYTDETVVALAAGGTRHLQVICPGFAADCLETLEEIAVQNREAFLAAGGRHFVYIPALNDDDMQITLLQQLVAVPAA